MSNKTQLLFDNELKNNDFEYFFKFLKSHNNFEELWRIKSLARETIKEWLIATRISIKTAENCANACSELIENGIKYSKYDTETFVSINIQNNKVSVKTINNTTNEKQKKEVMEYIDYLNENYNKLNDLYINRLKEHYQSGHNKLGLIKILMETKGRINYIKQKDDDNKIIRIALNMEID